MDRPTRQTGLWTVGDEDAELGQLGISDELGSGIKRGWMFSGWLICCTSSKGKLTALGTFSNDLTEAGVVCSKRHELRLE